MIDPTLGFLQSELSIEAKRLSETKDVLKFLFEISDYISHQLYGLHLMVDMADDHQIGYAKFKNDVQKQLLSLREMLDTLLLTKPLQEKLQ